MKSINWSYYFEEFKGRIFYLLGFMFILTLTSITELPLIGGQMQTAQDIEVLPNNAQIALFLKFAAIIVIFTVSWDLLAGYSGQVSFGHALFLGLGAYFTAYVKLGYPVSKPKDKQFHEGLDDNIHEYFGIPIDLATLYSIFIAAFLVAGIAIIISILTLRLKGPYFALVTLVLPLIARNLVTGILEHRTGGQAGIPMGRGTLVQQLETDPDIPYLDSLAEQSEAEFYVYFVIMFVCVLIMYLLARSRYGLVLKSLREDEVAAASSGVNVKFYKVTAYGISAFFAAVAGGLFGQYNGFASGGLFAPERSFEIIIYAILGGIGTIVGSIVGTFMMIIAIKFYLNDAFVDTLPIAETLPLALLLIIILRFQPRGLINVEPQFRNAMIFGGIWSFFLSFFDAGKILKGLQSININLIFFKRSIDITPGKWLFDTFGDKESGLMFLDMGSVEGRFVLYFIIGVIIGYFVPEINRKLRLKLWGVWPNLGKFDPPT